MKADPSKLRTAALFGFLAVALGAMGAHRLKDVWTAQHGIEQTAKMIGDWQTASFYHAVHTVVLLILAFAFSTRDQGRWIWNSFVLGILCFSGSIYAMTALGWKWLWPVTPAGGLLLMLGWLLLALQSRNQSKSI